MERKRYTPEFITNVILESLQRDTTLEQIPHTLATLVVSPRLLHPATDGAFSGGVSWLQMKRSGDFSPKQVMQGENNVS